MRGRFAALLALDSNGIDLPAQLRSFTVTYNTTLQNSRCVLSIQLGRVAVLSLGADVMPVVAG